MTTQFDIEAREILILWGNRAYMGEPTGISKEEAFVRLRNLYVQGKIDQTRTIYDWRTKGSVYQVPYARQVIRADAVKAELDHLQSQLTKKGK